eukprot:scaffold1.g5834.t1
MACTRRPSAWGLLLALSCAVHLILHARLRGGGDEEAFITTGGSPRVGRALSENDTSQPDECFTTVDWGAMPADPNTGLAAIFTQYNIVFGGGERYLLMAVAVMQQMGYRVHVLVQKDNVCQNVSQLAHVAHGLQVPLDPSRVEIHQDAPAKYTHFFLLGNEKYPQFKGLGFVNFYMCQFPFDLERKVKPMHLETFASYDYVLLNSVFSYRWYVKLMEPYFRPTLDAYHLIPSIDILHPPVHPPVNPPPDVELQSKAAQPLVQASVPRGSQEGHLAAINLFKSISEYLPPGSQLHLMGNLMKGHDAYLDMLRQQAIGANVSFHISTTSDDIRNMMAISLVQWHLTGYDVKAGSDPASEEHFGISVCEGMGQGVVPVVLDRGGLPDIVRHGRNGFLARDLTEVFQLDPAAASKLRIQAATDVQKFHDASFAKKFTTLAHRGKLTKSFRHLIAQSSDVVLRRQFKLPTKSRYAAVIIEPRPHYAFEYVTKNVLYHLQGNWSLYVFHGMINEQFVKDALLSVKNVKARGGRTEGMLDAAHTATLCSFSHAGNSPPGLLHSSSSPLQYWRLNSVVVGIPQLNRMLTSPWFWSIIRTERVLFFQTDSIMVHGHVGQFLQYDYVGAPWHQANERWSYSVFRTLMPDGVGNGGFSLRSIPAMTALSTRFGGNLSVTVQEDFMYVYRMSEDKARYRLAPRNTAYAFCLEASVEAGAGSCGLGGGRLRLRVPHPAMYYLSEDPRMRSDLLRLLTMSSPRFFCSVAANDTPTAIAGSTAAMVPCTAAVALAEEPCASHLRQWCEFARAQGSSIGDVDYQQIAVSLQTFERGGITASAVLAAHRRFTRVAHFTINATGVFGVPGEPTALTTARSRYYYNLLRDLHPHLPPTLNLTLAINALANNSMSVAAAWHKHGCDSLGLQDYRKLHGSFLAPPAYVFKRGISPILSPYIIPGCFADIIVPHIGTWTPQGRCPTDFWNGEWDKKAQVYSNFHRHRLVTLSQRLQREGRHDIDAGITEFIQTTSKKYKEQVQRFGKAQRLNPFRYRYNIIIDGNGAPDRMTPTMCLGSIILRATIYQEWFYSRLQPYKHYIPVRLDYADLTESPTTAALSPPPLLPDRLDWAKSHEEEVRRIGAAAAHFVNTRLRKADVLSYWFRLLIEMQRIYRPDE